MKYIDLCEIYNKLESTSKRLEKTYYVSQLIKKTKDEDIPLIMLLLEGKVFPAWDKRKVGMASRLVLKAINIATGIDTDKIEEKWKNTGDLGLVAEEYTEKKKQVTLFSQDLSIKKVSNNLQKLAELEGSGTVDRKVKLVAELLTSAKPLEAKYIIRTVLEDLRVGVGQGSVRDAIVWAHFPLIANLELSGEGNKYYYMDKDKPIEVEKIKVDKVIKTKSEFDTISILKTNSIACETKELARELFNYFLDSVEEAYNITTDWSEVVLVVREKGLKGLKSTDIKVGKPIKVMLYQKAQNIKDAFERVKTPCALEYKYDGFRLAIHIMDEKIVLFTRGFEDVTEQFPDVVRYVKEHVKVKNAILDSEAVGFNKKTTQYMAFQSVSQRIKRKYNIDELAKNFPVEVNVFDILYHDGKSLLKEEFHKRRALLGKIIDPTPRKIVLSSIIRCR